MAKFDFNNSQYAKFWGSRDAQNALQLFINDPDIIRRLPAFWRGQFSVDPMITARNYDGVANFSASMRDNSLDYMLDWRAPLADTQPRDKKGIEGYTGPIPDFAARGYVETAMEREARERMFEDYFGNDAMILSAYADDVQKMVLEADSTMSNLAAQALSTGRTLYPHGSGIHGPIYKAPVPEANFVNAGEKVWADADCKLLDQMAQIEQDFRDRTAFAGAMKWQVSRDTFYNIILKNAQVVEYINNWRTIKDKVVVSGWAITAEMFNEAFAVNEKISPIEIVEERQNNDGTPVKGWADNTAVLRPAGYAGQVKHTNLLDETMTKKYGSSVISNVFARLDIFTIVNTTLNNGNFKEWHTDLFVSAVPALEEFLNHIIVDIATADE